MNVYTVDLGALMNTIGSRDTVLFETVIAESEADEWTVAWVDPERGQHDLPYPIALRTVIDGGPFDSQQGHVYLKAFESICHHLGTEFSGTTFHLSWQDKLDKAFDRLGMNISVFDLMYGEGIAIFRDLDSAGVGWWPKGDCAAALDQWARPRNVITRATLRRAVLDDIGGYVNWLHESQRVDRDIVAFWG